MRTEERLYNNAACSEKSIERYLEERTRQLGGMALKYSSGVVTGYPDRVVLLGGGRMAWCEVKSKGRRPSVVQLYRHQRLRRLGQAVYVVDSREGVDRMLAEIAGQEGAATV